MNEEMIKDMWRKVCYANERETFNSQFFNTKYTSFKCNEIDTLRACGDVRVWIGIKLKVEINSNRVAVICKKWKLFSISRKRKSISNWEALWYVDEFKITWNFKFRLSSSSSSDD